MIKNYEIPISPNYVHNWGLKEAIRELLQNAIDSDKCGCKKDIIYDKELNTLHIINYGTTLPVESLVLGCSSKDEQDGLIGKFGEGYKLALVVLLRKGFVVNIINGNEKWIPSFKISETFNTQILNVEAVDYSSVDNSIVFSVFGITEQVYNNLLEYFPCIDDNYGETVGTSNGDILLDERFKGKMFVEGLFIQSDSNFDYGYNFKSETVELDRDRKAINYYDLRKLTAEAMVTAENCHPLIFKAISDSVTDVQDILDVVDEASDKFLEEYRDMLYDDKNLDENTLVATESVKRQLEQMNLDVPVVKGTEVESYLVAKANDKLGLIKEAKELSSKRSNEDEAFDWFKYSQYRKILEWLTKRKNISKAAKNELISICNGYPLYSSKFNLIKEFIPDDFDYKIESIDILREVIKEKSEE